MNLSTAINPSRFWLQEQVAKSPGLLRLSYLLSQRPRDHLVADDTELLIEGFPRSANTYAAWAFRLTNPDRKLADHVHTRAHVLLAVRRRIPALILLRAPEDAVRSLLVRQNNLTPEVALRRYIAFYEGINDYSSQLLFAGFETVINDYSRVINALNRRFGTEFHGFSEEIGQPEVFAAIDAANRRGHQGQVNPRSVPRPHPERERLKASTSLAGHEQRLRQANAIYQKFQQNAL